MSGYMSRIRVYFLNWNKPLNNSDNIGIELSFVISIAWGGEKVDGHGLTDINQQAKI